MKRTTDCDEQQKKKEYRTQEFGFNIKEKNKGEFIVEKF